MCAPENCYGPLSTLLISFTQSDIIRLSLTQPPLLSIPDFVLMPLLQILTTVAPSPAPATTTTAAHRVLLPHSSLHSTSFIMPNEQE